MLEKKNQRTINQFSDFSIFLSFTGNDGDSDDSDDHEEEFYYTEVELIVSEPSTSPNATSRYDCNTIGDLVSSFSGFGNRSQIFHSMISTQSASLCS